MKIHHLHYLDPGLERLIDRLVFVLTNQLEKIMNILDTLTADVQANSTVTASVQTLITNLVQQIKDAGTDPVALKALTDQLEANNAALTAAVTANTGQAVPPAA